MIRRLLMANYIVFDPENYLTIEPLEDGLIASLSDNDCMYCIDGGDWESLSAGENTPAINIGQTIAFKGYLKPNSEKGIGTFSINKMCNLKGNCMSLLYGDNCHFYDSCIEYCFCGLFKNCSTICEVSNNFLPATNVEWYCYLQMFYGCTSLTTAPDLPATNTEFKRRCYGEMFYGCTNLSYVKMLALDDYYNFYNDYITKDWLYGVAESGTFVKNKDAEWNTTGANGVPEGWTIEYV